jgi:hypothetical protein
MPQESNAAVDMNSYLPEESGHNDDDIQGLDFGNDLTEAAVEEAVVEETVVEEAVVEEAVEEEAVEEETAESEQEETQSEQEETRSEPESKKHMIPKRRLDDVVAKQRKAEQEAAELRKELAEARAAAEAAPDVDIRALSKQKQEATLDGDLDKAAEIEEQMLATLRQPTPEAINMEELEARVEAKMELKSTLTSVFEEYPQLDTESDSFDEDLNSEALVFQNAYLNQGYSPAEAVRRAADAAIRVVRPELLAVAEAPPVAKPRKTNVKANVAAANAQPPKMDQGESGGKSSAEMVDITKLTDDEFDALPEATRARMRGDLV